MTLPLNTLEIQARRAAVLREAAEAEAALRGSFNCGIDRTFPSFDLAVTYAARVAVGTLAAFDVATVPILIAEPWGDENEWRVFVGDASDDYLPYLDMACLASAILASGRAAQCDLCDLPVKAVEEAREIMRRYALGVAEAEALLRHDPHSWHKFGRGLLAYDPEVLA